MKTPGIRFAVGLAGLGIAGCVPRVMMVPPHEMTHYGLEAYEMPVPACMPVDYTTSSQGASGIILESLIAISERIQTANGIRGNFMLQPRQDGRAALATIRTNGTDSTIFLHPNGIRNVPLNSWAFIIGHEMAHHVMHAERGDGGGEIEADVRGANFAANAGYDTAAYLAWLIATQGSAAHESVEAIGRNL